MDEAYWKARNALYQIIISNGEPITKATAYEEVRINLRIPDSRARGLVNALVKDSAKSGLEIREDGLICEARKW